MRPARLEGTHIGRQPLDLDREAKVVNDYFRNWIISRGPDIFRSDDDTEQLLLLVRSYPEQMISRLEQLVATATPEQIAPGYSIRRPRNIQGLPLRPSPIGLTDN
jgi:hypothetical protein